MSNKIIPLYLNNSNNDINNDMNNYMETKKTPGNNSNKIMSVNGLKCIGPCYPPNTTYYNPLNLSVINKNFPSCPTKQYEYIDKGHKKKASYDKCYPEDVNEDYITFDIFTDVVQIANTPNNFLKEIYLINDISDLVNFLNNSFDTLPIYSQKRLVKVIFESYYQYIEFPKLLFVQKLVNVLEHVYNIDITKLSDDKKIIKILEKINENSLDLYDYFLHKF